MSNKKTLQHLLELQYLYNSNKKESIQIIKIYEDIVNKYINIKNIMLENRLCAQDSKNDMQKIGEILHNMKNMFRNIIERYIYSKIYEVVVKASLEDKNENMVNMNKILENIEKYGKTIDNDYTNLLKYYEQLNKLENQIYIFLANKKDKIKIMNIIINIAYSDTSNSFTKQILKEQFNNIINSDDIKKVSKDFKQLVSQHLEAFNGLSKNYLHLVEKIGVLQYMNNLLNNNGNNKGKTVDFEEVISNVENNLNLNLFNKYKLLFYTHLPYHIKNKFTNKQGAKILTKQYPGLLNTLIYDMLLS